MKHPLNEPEVLLPLGHLGAFRLCVDTEGVSLQQRGQMTNACLTPAPIPSPTRTALSGADRSSQI